jgi:hypothetical protein
MASSTSDEDRSALVVLYAGPSSVDALDPRSAEAPPPADSAAEVVAWFTQRGFEVGHLVGRSFAITGPSSTFVHWLGADPGIDGTMYLSGEALDESISPYVEAVLQTEPPDFGPGNP